MILNGSQQVQYIGLLFKFGTTFVPALTLAAYTLYPKEFKTLLIVIIGLFTSSYLSGVFLTKQPLFPFVLFVLAIFNRQGKRQKAIIIACIVFLFSVVFFVYQTRDAEVTFEKIVYNILFRFVTFLETFHIVHYIYDFGPFYDFNYSSTNSRVTEDVFNRNSNNIGIAPGYIGYFLVSYGFFGILGMLVFAIVVVIICRLLASQNVFERVLYFIVVCEFIPFFNDGVPSFYYSTSNAALFYLMLFSLFFVLYVRFLRKRF
ncbi:hypothetical protein [Pseudoalteromonas sp. MSK9-3]|uniref:hypothetical protein n=1 Tax=Pseudoalteromonas sp. MSK9-3 TaxID=1897633 RepID=UPI0011C35B04|nr:hypothetical protein [Pseudoalteromonas sp. MSK9-3]